MLLSVPAAGWLQNFRATSHSAIFGFGGGGGGGVTVVGGGGGGGVTVVGGGGGVGGVGVDGVVAVDVAGFVVFPTGVGVLTGSSGLTAVVAAVGVVSVGAVGVVGITVGGGAAVVVPPKTFGSPVGVFDLKTPRPASTATTDPMPKTAMAPKMRPRGSPLLSVLAAAKAWCPLAGVP